MKGKQTPIYGEAGWQGLGAWRGRASQLLPCQTWGEEERSLHEARVPAGGTWPLSQPRAGGRALRRCLLLGLRVETEFLRRKQRECGGGGDTCAPRRAGPRRIMERLSLKYINKNTTKNNIW
ncbi:hypothetical protein E2C01_007811 [Portunus trituberculatus]|uniref:Uncharacterized protein n=1 Tax=Portunus trituberculatus TaxID=210409 RepID=A0A5B7D0P2_PORTR|nr:hypothetical protein [Portunus trituberculatus]